MDAISRCSVPPDLPAAAVPPYAYLLGLYLGDGHIVRQLRTYRLTLSMDSRYVGMIDEATAALKILFPKRVVRAVTHPLHRCTRLHMLSIHWPLLLPQHGPGRKHARLIRLEPWQQEMTHAHTHLFLRGLFHSDGSRYIATHRVGGRTYRYVRYAFSNRSEDIKKILCDHLDLLGIPWTRPNDKDIQIARRAAVSTLDTFIGPKR